MDYKITMMKTKDVIPYDNIPRINDEAVKYVANSIQEFGFKQPIVVDTNNVVVTGHTRLKAAKRLGLKEVPVIVADDLTQDQIDAYRIADNSAGASSDWDDDLLSIEISRLVDFDFSDFGLFADNDDDDDPVKESMKDDNDEPLPKMELRAFEHYDYVVFVFDNTHDWLRIVQEFGLKRLDAGFVKKKIGLGRVVRGEELIKRLGD